MTQSRAIRAGCALICALCAAHAQRHEAQASVYGGPEFAAYFEPVQAVHCVKRGRLPRYTHKPGANPICVAQLVHLPKLYATALTFRPDVDLDQAARHGVATHSPVRLRQIHGASSDCAPRSVHPASVHARSSSASDACCTSFLTRFSNSARSSMTSRPQP